MSDFTYDELQIILLVVNIDINRSKPLKPAKSMIELRDKVLSKIDSYCEHEWRCWDDVHNTRECIKCNEKHQGEL